MRKPTEEEIARNPQVGDMMEELDTISKLTVVSDSQGGKILVKNLVKDIVSCVDTLSAKYSKLTLQEFIAECADMKSKIDLVRVITRAPKNKKALEAMIEETMKE